MTCHHLLCRDKTYIHLDNVLVNFQSGIDKQAPETIADYEGRLDEVPGIFGLMEPMGNAIEAYEALSREYDVYILSTSPWENESALIDKLRWVKKHLGEVAYKRLILSHHKNLNKGDYLIDDRTKNGADKFEGEHIHFGTDKFRNWDDVTEYLLPNKSK